MDKTDGDLQGLQHQVHGIRLENRLLYIQGYKYPLKGIPELESVKIANRIKENLKRGRIYQPPTQYLGVTAQEIYTLLLNLGLTKAAYPIAYVLEYDQAYRLRLQDLFSSVSQNQLQNPWTILELSTAHKQRDRKNYVHKKLKWFFLLAFLYALTHKKAWKQAIESANYQNLTLDESDIYWACQKKDYNYLGKTFAERQAILNNMIE